MSKKPALKVVKVGKPWQAKARAELTDTELAAWDGEIEEEFRRETRKQSKRATANKFIGCLWEFFQTVVLATKGNQTALAVAQLIYRRCKIQNSLTVTLATDELAALDIPRNTCRQALRQLQAAGLIQLQPIAPGHKPVITLLWPR